MCRLAEAENPVSTDTRRPEDGLYLGELLSNPTPMTAL